MGAPVEGEEEPAAVGLEGESGVSGTHSLACRLWQ